MLSSDCINCKHVVWLIALGQGVRCKHPENQKYKKEGTTSKTPVVIPNIPNGCEYFEGKK